MLFSRIQNLVNCEVIELEDLEELAEFITLHDWAPAVFRDNYRKKANFRETDLLVFDVDNGCTLGEAKEYFKDYSHIIATTRNHQVEKNGVVCDRFRVILTLDKPIKDAATYAATWHHYAKRYPFIDEACKDESRFYYKSTSVVSLNLVGAALQSIAATPPQPVTAARPELSNLNPNTRGNLSTRTSLFLANGVGSGTWNSRLHAAAKDMQEQLFPIEEALEIFSAMRNKYFSGELDAKDLSTIESAYKTAPKYAPKLTPVEVVPTRKTDGSVFIDFPQKKEGKNGKEYVDPLHSANMSYLISEVMQLSLEKNELKDVIEVAGKPLDDFQLSLIRARARDCGLSSQTELIMDTMNVITLDKRYHPFKRVVDAVVWDGHDHLADLFQTIRIDTAYLEYTSTFKQYLYKWFVGVIAKTYSLGDDANQTNMVLTFLGPQNCGKSRWLNHLSIAPDIVNEAPLSPDDKDSRLRMLKYVIWNMAELDSVTKRADASALKDVLTRSKITDRAAYGRLDKTGRNNCSFCASVNDETFLKDTTGNRRYLTVPVKLMESEHTISLVQCFAQAKALWLQGFKHYFNDEETSVVERINANFLPTDRVDYIASRVPKGENWASVQEIFSVLDPNFKYSHGDISKMGRILSAAGFKSERKRTDDPSKPQIKKYQTGLGLEATEMQIVSKKISYNN